MAMLSKVVHWVGVGLLVPFGVLAILFPDKERLVLYEKRIRVPLPRYLTHWSMVFSHLTMVSHITYCGHFIIALCRDHGILTLTPSYYSKLYSATSLTMSIFVSVAFWSIATAGAENFLPADSFPADLSAEKRKVICFRMMFAPEQKWQVSFQRFMVYIHTVCPLAMIVDAAIFRPGSLDWYSEAGAVVIFGSSYLGWNMFCWWLHSLPPYPFQLRLYKRGLTCAIASYSGFLMLSLILLQSGRFIRRPDWRDDRLLGSFTAILLGGVLWLSNCAKPWTRSLAQFHGITISESDECDGSSVISDEKKSS